MKLSIKCARHGVDLANDDFPFFNWDGSPPGGWVLDLSDLWCPKEECQERGLELRTIISIVNPDGSLTEVSRDE